MKRLVFLAVFLVVVVGLTSMAWAQPKPNVFDGGNMWNITFYNDPAPTHTQWATQRICFLPYATVGTSIQGAWFSLSFPDWNGRYYQEGDEVRMTGDYAQNVGHDHMEFRHDRTDQSHHGEGSGTWDEWREDAFFGTVIGWGNTRFVRVGSCLLRSAGVGLAAIDARPWEVAGKQLSESLPPRLLVGQEKPAPSPNAPRQASLVDYLSENAQIIDSFFDIFVK